MRGKAGISLFFVFLVSIPMYSQVSTAEPDILRATIYVDDNNTQGPWDGTLEHPYQHIQDGINNSFEGDTVFVFSGVYRNFVFGDVKGINIIGENQKTTIINVTLQYVQSCIINLSANDINFRNFTIFQQNYKGNFGGDAVILWQVSNCNISSCIFVAENAIQMFTSKNNTISNNSMDCVEIGIEALHGSCFNTIKGNYFTVKGFPGTFGEDGLVLWHDSIGNIVSGNFFYDCYSRAIRCSGSHDNLIENNLIIGNGNTSGRTESGIRFDTYDNPDFVGTIVRNNTVMNCVCGIYADGQTVIGNIIENCSVTGLAIKDGPNADYVKDNIIRNCKCGLSFYDIHGRFGFSDFGKTTIVEGNIFEQCNIGLQLWMCKSLTFNKNTFSHDNTAIIIYTQLRSYIGHNKFTNNNFMNNTEDVQPFRSFNSWSHNWWGQPLSSPKPIYGLFPFYVQYDKNPAQQPN